MTVKEQFKAFIKLLIAVAVLIIASLGISNIINNKIKEDHDQKVFQFANQQALERVEMLLYQNLIEQKQLLHKYDSIARIGNPDAPKKLPKRILKP